MEMTRQKLMQLLDELIEECHTRGIEGTIAIYGGTAMVYYVPELRTTQDVDSMFRPFYEIQSAAEVVGNRNNVPNNWLNMQIHDVMPPIGDDNPEVYSDANGLKVTFASKKYLLAMKAMSDRRSQKDLDDAAVLFNALRLKIGWILMRLFIDTTAWNLRVLRNSFLKISKIVPMRFGSKDRFRNDF